MWKLEASLKSGDRKNKIKIDKLRLEDDGS